MEWIVLVLLAGVAAALIVLSRVGVRPSQEDGDQTSLLEERRELQAELRELDEDAAAGRISAEDRAAGRRSLAPRFRAVTEALRARGIDEDRE